MNQNVYNKRKNRSQTASVFLQVINMHNESKRILVVDDEPKIVDVVASYLLAGGYRVSKAFTGQEAYTKFLQEPPDLVILDWMLPDISGEEVCRTLRKQSAVPVIMLTAKAGEEDILRGFRFGADDYVTKPFSPRQLTARVEAVLRRSEREEKPVLCFDGGALEIDEEAMQVRKNKEIVSLTPNEFRLVCMLAKHPHKVFTREELIAGISGGDYEGFDRVIDTHVKNIRQKLEEDTRCPHYILTVHGVGYKFGGSKP